MSKDTKKEQAVTEVEQLTAQVEELTVQLVTQSEVAKAKLEAQVEEFKAQLPVIRRSTPPLTYKRKTESVVDVHIPLPGGSEAKIRFNIYDGRTNEDGKPGIGFDYEPVHLYRPQAFLDIIVDTKCEQTALKTDEESFAKRLRPYSAGFNQSRRPNTGQNNNRQGNRQGRTNPVEPNIIY